MVIVGSQCLASIVNITSLKPNSNASWIQVQPVMFLVTEICRSSNRMATLKWKAAKQSSKLFDGSLMKPLGEVNLQVIHGGQTRVLKFQVVSGTNKPLLSAETCQELRLLKLGAQTEVLTLDVKQAPLTVQSILQDYQDVFKGLGHIGTSSFVLDPSAIPVQHTSRRIPIALKTEAKAKLEDLERRGIIVKEAAPTEWINNMVVVAKPKKICICLDPQELNKVIQRPKYQMPTLVELLPKLCKAKVFSTLDAKDGFYQISLDNVLDALWSLSLSSDALWRKPCSRRV